MCNVETPVAFVVLRDACMIGAAEALRLGVTKQRHSAKL
jgi:hypothetical protein